MDWVVMMYRVLIDDKRSFTDGRDCVVARDLSSAVNVLSQGEHIDELWLDFDLGGMDSVSDVLFELKRNGVTLSVGKVFVHSSGSYGVVDLLSKILVSLGVHESVVSAVDSKNHF